VYVFDVAESANKTEVKKAVEKIYKVTPKRVNILSVPKKETFVRGKAGMKGGGRKAVVYLKEGDKIEFV
jgi:large subunit ribosomal protein L23